MDNIVATVPQGATYMSSEHTFRFFREEMWLPSLMDYRNPLGWLKDPSDMIEKARKKARELLRSAENQSPLSDARRQEIKALVKEADKVAVGEAHSS